MKTVLVHIFTGPDNATYDGARVMGGIGFLWWISGTTAKAFLPWLSWDATAVGSALCAVVLGICGAVRVKASTEPGG